MMFRLVNRLNLLISKNKHIFYLTIIYLVPTQILAQKVENDISSNQLSTFIEQESMFKGGKIVENSVTTTIPELDFISYLRSDNNIPDVDLIVRYVFYRKDSLLMEIQYEWDISNFEKPQKKNTDFRRIMASFFLEMEEKLKSDLGNGIETGNLNRNTVVDNDGQFFKKISRINGKTKIDLLLKMINKSEEKNERISPVHRILLTYRMMDFKEKNRYEEYELLKKNNSF